MLRAIARRAACSHVRHCRTAAAALSIDGEKSEHALAQALQRSRRDFMSDCKDTERPTLKSTCSTSSWCVLPRSDEKLEASFFFDMINLFS